MRDYRKPLSSEVEQISGLAEIFGDKIPRVQPYLPRELTPNQWEDFRSRLFRIFKIGEFSFEYSWNVRKTPEEVAQALVDIKRCDSIQAGLELLPRLEGCYSEIEEPDTEIIPYIDKRGNKKYLIRRSVCANHGPMP